MRIVKSPFFKSMTLFVISLLVLCAVLIGVTISVKIDEKNSARKWYTLQEMEQEISDLAKQKKEYKEKIKTLEINVTQLTTQYDNLKANIDDATNVFEKLRKTYANAEEHFQEEYNSKINEWTEQRKQEYIKAQQEFTDQFVEENKRKLVAAQELEIILKTLKSQVNAATALQKEIATKENYNEFHSLQLDDQSLYEINKIREAVKGISVVAELAINKVIWKVYYEKPYSDLVGRVLGSNVKIGIYKITNIQNGLCYVGQAVNVADRWKQHIKRAIGAEPLTNNKLYPAMKKFGVENFTFELIEECKKEELDAKEDYWQDFYNAKEYGYSIK